MVFFLFCFGGEGSHFQKMPFKKNILLGDKAPQFQLFWQAELYNRNLLTFYHVSELAQDFTGHKNSLTYT